MRRVEYQSLCRSRGSNCRGTWDRGLGLNMITHDRVRCIARVGRHRETDSFYAASGVRLAQHDCRCDERLKTKAEDSTRLVYTGLSE